MVKQVAPSPLPPPGPANIASPTWGSVVHVTPRGAAESGYGSSWQGRAKSGCTVLLLSPLQLAVSWLTFKSCRILTTTAALITTWGKTSTAQGSWLCGDKGNYICGSVYSIPLRRLSIRQFVYLYQGGPMCWGEGLIYLDANNKHFLPATIKKSELKQVSYMIAKWLRNKLCLLRWGHNYKTWSETTKCTTLT